METTIAKPRREADLPPLPPRGVETMRAFYALTPDAPVYQEEFGFLSMERWKREGRIRDGDDVAALFGFDPPAKYHMGNLGWCEAGFCPAFPEKVLEDQGDYELVQDFAGRKVKCFRGRRIGFMPEYVDHPVKDIKSWEEQCLWRMDPASPGRQEGIQNSIAGAKAAAACGHIISAGLVGGYMYLRSLMGPMEVMYIFYDNPGLIRRCMEAWFTLADAVYARMQTEVVFDELFIGEDICYNCGPLISIDMMKEFLFPYYRQLITNIRARQLDKGRTLHFQVDSDGFSDLIIPHYRELGMDYLSPFEAASNCDVVRTAREYPDLLIRGGFDKRIMARGKDAIDREVDRIMPAMKRRGGYIPTCDHGVPEEVSFDNYLHYRQRMLEYSR